MIGLWVTMGIALWLLGILFILSFFKRAGDDPCEFMEKPDRKLTDENCDSDKTFKTAAADDFQCENKIY